MRWLSPWLSVLRQPLTVVLSLYLCNVLLVLAVIPPWQNPDEPQHVAGVVIPARMHNPDNTRRVEREIVRSMAAHKWWTYYGRDTPNPLPEQFGRIASVSTSATSGAGQIYYRGMALLVRILAPSDVKGQMYFLRYFSAIVGILTLCCCWAAACCCLPRGEATVATAVVAMNPQFIIVSTTASPDAVINVCGAFMWWQACRLLRNPHAGTAIVAVWGAAVCGVLARRIGLLFLPIAAIVSMVAVAAAFRRSTRDGMLFAAGGLLAVVGVAAVAIALPGQVTDVARGMVVSIITLPHLDLITPKYFGGFTLTLFDSAWLNAGWMRLPAPRFWLNVMHALTALAAAGVVRALWRGTRVRRVLLMALALVAVPVAGIYAYYFTLAVGPSARYLFPVAGPLSLLLWVGIRDWWPEHQCGIVATVLLTTMAAFELVAWTVVLIPAYV